MELGLGHLACDGLGLRKEQINRRIILVPTAPSLWILIGAMRTWSHSRASFVLSAFLLTQQSTSPAEGCYIICRANDWRLLHCTVSKVFTVYAMCDTTWTHRLLLFFTLPSDRQAGRPTSSHGRPDPVASPQPSAAQSNSPVWQWPS